MHRPFCILCKRKAKENNTTKTNEHRMSDDNNSENQDLRESFETQTISKLSSFPSAWLLKSEILHIAQNKMSTLHDN
jgi:hypothetical protein